MKNRKGFTIVELVIVIAVIAILAAVLIPTFSGIVGRANESAAVQETRTALTNVLSGNVKNGVLNGAEFVVNNGNKVYQFTYGNGQLITEDNTSDTSASKKAGDDNVGHGLELAASDTDHPVHAAGDTKVCGYTTVVIKNAAAANEDKVKAAFKAALGLTGTAACTLTISADEKTIAVSNGTDTITFDVFFNSDFNNEIIVFIK